MAGVAAEGSQFDTYQFDSKMDELLSADGQDFFTSYDEVTKTFDALGLLENLLRGIYAYVMAGVATEGSQFDTYQLDFKMDELLCFLDDAYFANAYAC
nr:eukaryotic initiation factor 4A-15-like [Tanacetum cinerariifolium]